MGANRRESDNSAAGNIGSPAPSWANGQQPANSMLANWLARMGSPTNLQELIAQFRGGHSQPLAAIQPQHSAIVGQQPVAPMVNGQLPPGYGAPAMGQQAPAMGGPGQGSPLPLPPATSPLAQTLAGGPFPLGVGRGLQPLAAARPFGG